MFVDVYEGRKSKWENQVVHLSSLRSLIQEVGRLDDVERNADGWVTGRGSAAWPCLLLAAGQPDATATGD